MLQCAEILQSDFFRVLLVDEADDPPQTFYRNRIIVPCVDDHFVLEGKVMKKFIQVSQELDHEVNDLTLMTRLFFYGFQQDVHEIKPEHIQAIVVFTVGEGAEAAPGQPGEIMGKEIVVDLDECYNIVLFGPVKAVNFAAVDCENISFGDPVSKVAAF